MNTFTSLKGVKVNQIIRRAKAKGIDTKYLSDVAKECKKILKRENNLVDLSANLHWLDATYYAHEGGCISSEDYHWLISEIKTANAVT